MRLTAFGLLLAGSWLGANATSSVAVTEVSGVVRSAATREPLPGATVFAGDETASAQTDAEGRFAIRVSRDVPSLAVRKDGFLAFQYPLLRLTTDTLTADIELRTNPPGPESYATAIHIAYLCVLIEAPDRLVVRNSCGAFRPNPSDYSRRIIKHNPWNPYFGPAGDRGGVLIFTRLSPATGDLAAR